jgi:ferredoxin
MAPPCDCLIRFLLVSVGLPVFQRRFPVLGDREGVSVFTPVCERKPCIDCGVCEPECPVDAIKPDTEPGLKRWLENLRHIGSCFGRIGAVNGRIKHHAKRGEYGSE